MRNGLIAHASAYIPLGPIPGLVTLPHLDSVG